MSEKNLWTVADVANYLQVKESAVRRWVYERRIRFHKVGALVRFNPDELKEDVEAGRIGKRKDEL